MKEGFPSRFFHFPARFQIRQTLAKSRAGRPIRATNRPKDRRRKAKDRLEKHLYLLEFIISHLPDATIAQLREALSGKQPELLPLFDSLTQSISGGQPALSGGALASELKMQLQEARERPNFVSRLRAYMQEKRLTHADVYTGIDMRRSNWEHFLKVSQEYPVQRTSHENYLRLCVVLQLNYWQAKYFLALAGVAFTRDPLDRVVVSCLAQSIFNPIDVDEELKKWHLPLLFPHISQ